jgi:hypothetical protein
MDFLNALPPEVWRHIVALSAEYTFSGARCLSYFDQIDYDTIKDNQLHLSRLQLVCRALYPFVEEFLYSDVLLISTRGCEAFLRSATTQKSNGRTYGERTKSIYFNFRTSSFNPEIAGKVLVTCPNLVSLQVNIESRRADSSIPLFLQMDTSGRLLLNSFAWTGVAAFTELRQLSLRYPKLASLKLGSNCPIYGAVTFPSVERLSINLTNFHNRIGTFLDLPSLKHLHLQMYRGLELYSILQDEGHKLLSLELAQAYVGLDNIFLPKDLFELCPKLEYLAFENVGTISPQFLANSQGAADHPLSTLVIYLDFWDLTRHLLSLQCHAKNFAPEWCPNLRSVLLIRRSWGDPKRGQFEKTARDLFPRSTVEFKRDPLWDP